MYGTRPCETSNTRPRPLGSLRSVAAAGGCSGIRRVTTFYRNRPLNPPERVRQLRTRTSHVRCPCRQRSQLLLFPRSRRGACLVEHLRQLLALFLGGPLTCDAMLVRPLIRLGVPRREHLVVMAGDLGHRNRRCPAHAPATLANLIWSFHLTAFCLVGRKIVARSYDLCSSACATNSAGHLTLCAYDDPARRPGSRGQFM